MQNSTLGACNMSAFRNSQVSAFSSGRMHQNTHKLEGTVISCLYFRGIRFSQVSARTGSTVLVNATALGLANPAARGIGAIGQL